MERVEEQIVQASKQLESVAAAPKELSSDQSTVLVALQQLLNAPGVERKKVTQVLGQLSKPMQRAPVKELKGCLVRYQKDSDGAAFVAACEEIGSRYAGQPTPSATPDENDRRAPTAVPN